ncbi:MAG: class I SAM-dependent methyltransferase [Pseudonocardiaceae bacterium]
MRTVAQFFDDRYASQERYWWKQPHAYSSSPDDHAGSLITQQVLRVARARGPGRAIDLGSGEGADAIRLALMGWEVEAVEISSVGAQKIKWFANRVGARVTVHQADIAEFERAGKFDLVICNGVLHYIEDKATVCGRIQEMTSHGGTNAVSLWSSHSAVPPCHEVVPIYPDAEKGDVVQAYSTWEKSLMYFERNREEMGHDEMPRHTHSFIKMLASKL